MLNRYGITRSMHKALETNTYDLQYKPFNVRSITSITNDPKHEILKKRHEKEMLPNIDCQNNNAIFLGNAVHEYIEYVLKDDNSFMTEERWIIDINTWELWWITDATVPIDKQPWYKEDTQYLTGKLDCYDRDEQIIEDYKMTKKSMTKYPMKESYVWQINIHKMALGIAGLPVNKGIITAFFKDHEAWDLTKKKFPTTQVRSFNIHLEDDRTIRDYIKARIKLYVEMEKLEDDEIPHCENTYTNNGRCLSQEPNLWCTCNMWCNYWESLVK